MHKVKITSRFSSAHFLRNYKGKCENLHGHNWKVEVVVSGEELNSLGMVIDFSDLKKLTKSVLDELDHKNLNDLEYFKKNNPSSEEIAKYVFIELEPVISAKGCILDEIRVWETDNSCAIYQG
ncbi:MAG: 6-carboxytetrahydropterin synthase QueD [Candidatus Omnitrophica bacterium]|nr:6-carboxytetrahydropterin synthase QueD [Candidatus Omnitrophota bacterium]